MLLATLLLQVHDSEEFYVIGWKGMAIVGTFLVIWLLLKFTNREPEVSSMKGFVDLLNARGGNILICLILSLYFFAAAMKVFYHAMGLVSNHQLDETSAILMMALQFVTGTAFGGAFGALLKTMSPETSSVSSQVTNSPNAPATATTSEVKPVTPGQTLTASSSVADTPVVEPKP